MPVIRLESDDGHARFDASHEPAAGSHRRDPPGRGGAALEESRALGIGFLVFGLIQIGMAVAVVVKPTPRLAAGAVVVQLVAIAIWALSRTAGLPLVGEGAEPVGLADGITVALEAATLLTWAAARSGQRIAGATATLVVVAVVAAGGASAAIAALGREKHEEHGEEHDEAIVVPPMGWAAAGAGPHGLLVP